MTNRDKIVAGGALGAALLLWFVVHYWHNPTPIVAPAVHVTIDSLKQTRKPDEHTIDSLTNAGLAHSANGASAAGRARTSEAHAGAAGTRADSAAARARRNDPVGSDSLADAWKEAYELRTAERDTLLIALAQKDSAYRDAAGAANDFRIALSKSESRRVAVENLNHSLTDALTKAERGCRVLFVPCPSRKVAFVLGAVGSATVLVLTHNP